MQVRHDRVGWRQTPEAFGLGSPGRPSPTTIAQFESELAIAVSLREISSQRTVDASERGPECALGCCPACPHSSALLQYSEGIIFEFVPMCIPTGLLSTMTLPMAMDLASGHPDPASHSAR